MVDGSAGGDLLMAANEAKKVLSYLSRIASLSFTNAPIALYPRPLLTLSRPG